MKGGIFVGLSTIDVIYRVDRFPSQNSKVVALGQEMFVGGPATNASITFAHLGGRSTVVTALGRHELSSVVRKELHRYSIHLLDLAPDFDGVPVISSIAVNATGERNVISANATRVRASSSPVDAHALEQTAILLLDGHYMESCKNWARAAFASGIEVVFDGGSWKDGTEELLKSVNTAICSADFFPPGCMKVDEVLDYLRDSGVKRAAITNGSEPVRFFSDGSSGIVKVPQVQVVDTMGAGDIFHGAYCYYSTQGHGFVESLEKASAIATESCRFSGTREWIKHPILLSEIQDLIEG